MTGRVVDAQEALRIGLLLEIVEDLPARAQELAESIAANAPLGLASVKANMNASFQRTLAEAHEAEGAAQVACFGSSDMAEGVAAFIEKRPPRFTGT